ncbi:MAG: TadE family protein [Acidimicrobiia bacterium]
MEAALITPFVLLLFFGMIEFGLLLNRKLAVSDATREGARAAAALVPAAAGTTDDVTPALLARIQTALAGYSPSNVNRIVIFDADSNGYPVSTGTGANQAMTSDAGFKQITSGSSNYCKLRCIYWTPRADNASSWSAITKYGADWPLRSSNINGCLPTSASNDKRTRIGVYIELSYTPLTPGLSQVIPDSDGTVKLGDKTLVRVEPTAGASAC